MSAWNETTDPQTATSILFIVDADDSALGRYQELSIPHAVIPRWLPMVQKLNRAAVQRAEQHFALGFMGDDHLPRTPGWNTMIVEQLKQLGTGIAYGNDLYQGERIPTQWFMTSDIVRALRRMVPAPVDHLYCDNAVLALGQGTGCIRYLSDVVIEHMHPVAGKASSDAGYQRVNSRRQYQRDSVLFNKWRRGTYAHDVRVVQRLRSR